MADLGGIILGPHVSWHETLCSESELNWSFGYLSWWVFWNLKFVFWLLLFNFNVKYCKTVQNRYLTIFDHQKSFIAKKMSYFLESVKTVISKKREIVQKSRKVWYSASALYGDFIKNVFGWQYGALRLLKQRNFIDHLERVLKCLSKIWSVRSRTWSQSPQNWSYFVCIYFDSFQKRWNIIRPNRSSNNSFLQQRDLDMLQ